MDSIIIYHSMVESLRKEAVSIHTIIPFGGQKLLFYIIDLNCVRELYLC